MQKEQKKYWSSFYRKRIYLKFLLKYLTGFLIILAPCILIVFIAWTITREQVLSAGQVRFQEGMKEISSEISKMRILENDIQKSEYFQELSKMDGQIPWGKYEYFYKANGQLEGKIYLYEFSPFFFILFENNDLVLSSHQCDDRFSERYYGNMMEAYAGGELLDAESIRNLVLTDTKSIYSFIRLDGLSYYTDEKCYAQNPILCVVNRAHVLYSTSNYRTSYVILPETLIDMLLTEESREKGIVRIIDGDGSILLDYGSTELLTAEGEEITDVGTHWIMSAFDKEETGWKVQIGIPKEVITQQIHLLYKLIYAYIVCGLLLVVILAYYFGRKQYQELKNFYLLIPEREQEMSQEEITVQNAVRKPNEYDVLRCIFQRMAENSKIYLQQKVELEKQNQAIRLEKLIVGGISTQEELEELERAGVVDSDFYCVAVARLLVEKEEKYGIALLAFMEYLKKNWQDNIFHIHTGVYDELFVFSLSCDGPPDVSQVQKLFEGVAHILNEEMEITVGVGISSIGTGLFNLKRCYTQACQVLEAYYQKEKNAVNYYRIDVDNSRDTAVNLDFLNQIYYHIVHLNTEKMEKKFFLVKQYYYKHPVQFEAQKEQYFYSVRNILYNAMCYFGEKPDENGMLPVFDKADSVNLLTEKLQTAAGWLIRQVSVRKEEEKGVFHEEILSFVESNFADKNMSVNLACGELGITERYLQTVIKEKTGDTFAVYLEKLRVGRASELLLNTDKSNEQIADEVGFVGISTFYRVFNKRMGMSPKAFRDELFL